MQEAISEHTESQGFRSLQNESFVLLTTYRKNGIAVPTTVWFALEDGNLYLTTYRGAGKAKRIRANPSVTVAASDRVGNVHGPSLTGQARILNEQEQSVAISALRAKYGAMYEQMTGRMDLGQPSGMRIFILVEPV